MLRGVNRRIIEVNDTGSDYFEKALFFVKGNTAITPDSLEKEAQKVMEAYLNCGTESKRQGYLRYTDLRRKMRRMAIFLLSAVVVLVAGIIIITQL